jgi:O-Antigen ligase
MLNGQILRKYYIGTLSATVFFMPLSVWLLTFFIIAMFLVWIADGGLMRIADLRKDKIAILIFSGTYFVYLIWMIKTSDLSFGLRELKLKLPLLVFPLVIGLSQPLNKKEIKIILTFFIAGVVLSSIIGIIAYSFGKDISEIDNPRKISPFISHIRLALMTNFSVVCSAWYCVSDTTRKDRFFYLIAAIWLTVFLFLLLSLTGIIIFAVLLIISLFLVVRRSQNFFLKISLILIVAASLISSVLFISGEIKSFYKKGSGYSYPLKTHTINGNPYLHYPDRKDIENGNPVWIYLNEEELRKEWNSRSLIKYDSTDLRNQKLRYTLIRYLTSAGLTKDSAGLAKLRDIDIRYIENGITNILFTRGKPVKSKIYEIIWQIDYWLNGGNPSGHSVTQRIEYLEKGWHLYEDNILLGTGTGDVKHEFINQFRKENSLLEAQFIYLPHNQFLTFLISFGIIGFLIISCSILIPAVMKKVFRSFLFNCFFIIILLSMLGEDTLETHPGVSFFAYFYSLFVFGNIIDEL